MLQSVTEKMKEAGLSALAESGINPSGYYGSWCKLVCEEIFLAMRQAEIEEHMETTTED